MSCARYTFQYNRLEKGTKARQRGGSSGGAIELNLYRYTSVYPSQQSLTNLVQMSARCWTNMLLQETGVGAILCLLPAGAPHMLRIRLINTYSRYRIKAKNNNAVLDSAVVSEHFTLWPCRHQAVFGLFFSSLFLKVLPRWCWKCCSTVSKYPLHHCHPHAHFPATPNLFFSTCATQRTVEIIKIIEKELWKVNRDL